jgi:ATP-dependent RNA helicase DeaD
VPGFEELHVHAAMAAALDALGWSATDPAAREAAPTAARGNNLVAVLPPSPAYAAPALAGLLSRLVGGEGMALLLCPPAQLDEWGAVARSLSAGTGVRVEVAHGTARALRRLRDAQVDLLVASPETALTLLERSALKAEALGAVVLAWPENFDGTETLAPLMQDLPKDAQRIVFTSDPDAAAALVERYARKALTIGTRPAETASEPPVGPVRTVTVPWQRRTAALADLVETLDPTSLVVWAADHSRAEAIGRTISLDDQARLATGDAPEAQVIIAYDLPSAARLRQLLSAGEVVLLVPPGTESYVERIASPRRPLRLTGVAEAAAARAIAERAAIVRALEAGKPDRALLTLAPLFERHDPAAVAAALYDLWSAGQSAAALPAAIPEGIPAIAKVYVGVGKKDGATANDIVAVLTKDLRVDRGKIGRIELRDAYSLVELPAQDAERIANELNGQTIRRKRVAARVDRGGSKPVGGSRPPMGGGRPPAGGGRPSTGGRPPAGGRPRTPR